MCDRVLFVERSGERLYAARLRTCLLYTSRTEVYIATKTAAQNAEDFWKDLHTSLTNLRTDYIDLYQFHNPASVSYTHLDVYKRQVEALCKSTGSILSSGLTTVIGFLALVLMQFQIGPDLGLALAKGCLLYTSRCV